MNVALRQLRAFLAVARRGSFSRAAEDVGASQSALSLSVRQLENELGLKLLDRTTRQVTLTTVGETLVATGSRLIDELDVTLRELRDIGQQRRGRVVMACVPSVARGLMPKCVGYCADKWPNISLSINDIAASEVVRKVSLGEMEFGLASGDIGGTELDIHPLMEDPFCFVCRKDDPWAKKGKYRMGTIGRSPAADAQQHVGQPASHRNNPQSKRYSHRNFSRTRPTELEFMRWLRQNSV